MIMQIFCYTEATPRDFATQRIHSYTRSTPQILWRCEGVYKFFAIFRGPLLIRMSGEGWVIHQLKTAIICNKTLVFSSFQYANFIDFCPNTSKHTDWLVCLNKKHQKKQQNFNLAVRVPRYKFSIFIAEYR